MSDHTTYLFVSGPPVRGAFISLLLVVLLLLPFPSCSIFQDTPPLDEDEYTILLAERYVLRTMQDIMNDPPDVDELFLKILEQHNTTEEAFYESHAYYTRDLELHHEIMLNVRYKLDQLNMSLNDYEQERQREATDSENAETD
ncbi:DUF4296 domain-containing protein [Balneolaceae bacterium ANBcel3]|nr:DUF4296 domain-containing protein [Balneolaceae bacterium ANBcel3]